VHPRLRLRGPFCACESMLRKITRAQQTDLRPRPKFNCHFDDFEQEKSW